MLKTKEFYGLQIVNENQKVWFFWLDQILSVKKPSSATLIMTPNPEQIVLAKKEKLFYQDLQAADILLPDGQGLVWAAGVKERLTGSDTVNYLLSLAKEKNLKTLLIGGYYQHLANNNRLKISVNNNQTNIYYTQGYKNINKINHNETKLLQRFISDIKPDIVLVAFGASAQERWLVENRDLLRASQVKIAMSVGGSFDFLVGKIKRAPKYWQALGLEWLWRLIQEPQRIKRQLVLPYFVFLVLTKKLN